MLSPLLAAVLLSGAALLLVLASCEVASLGSRRQGFLAPLQAQGAAAFGQGPMKGLGVQCKCTCDCRVSTIVQ